MSMTQPHSALENGADIERDTFNAAFYELGLRWHWDGPTFDALAGSANDRSRVRHYLETEQAHLLRAYEAEFLTDAILLAKERCRRALLGFAPRSTQVSRSCVPAWAEVGF